jgi:hypothetical protein
MYDRARSWSQIQARIDARVYYAPEEDILDHEPLYRRVGRCALWDIPSVIQASYMLILITPYSVNRTI